VARQGDALRRIVIFVRVTRYGEGRGYLQSDSAWEPLKNYINNGWYGLTDDAKGECGCQN
jgi:hypothetical protein